ncbi:MAG: hypothetical protein AAF449_07390 [Myxococcota bacterium]
MTKPNTKPQNPEYEAARGEMRKNVRVLLQHLQEIHQEFMDEVDSMQPDSIEDKRRVGALRERNSLAYRSLREKMEEQLKARSELVNRIKANVRS